MKQILLIVIFLGVNFLNTSVNGIHPEAEDGAPKSCDAKALITKSKEGLKPDYIYDGFKLIRVKLKNKAIVKTLLFPVNSEVDFKYVFSSSALPEGAKVRIYNSKKPSEETLKFKGVFDGNTDILTFETTKDMWAALIEIEIPPAGDDINLGCICVLAGYRL